MGAACSSSVLKKYGDVKAYLQSKKCMTFDIVETFLPTEDGPPVILIGENHSENDSDFGAQACVTAFRAMNELVSNCEDPSTKICFLVESDIFYSPPPKELGERVRFNLFDVRQKIERHAHLYSGGLEVVHFDIFHHIRSYFMSARNQEVKSLDYDDFQMLKMDIKACIEDAFEHFDADDSNFLQSVFDECDGRVLVETELHRKTVGKMIDAKNAEDQRAQVVYRRRLEKEVEANFDAMLRNEWKPPYTEADNFRMTRIIHFEMFKIVSWIYFFTSSVLLREGPGLNGDLKYAQDVLNIFYDKMIDDPKLTSLFSFITLCGDYISYAVFLRPRLHEKGSNNIYVLYGGSMHMLQFASLIEQSSTHKQDFSRASERACSNPPKVLRPFCDNERRQTPEEFVDNIIY